jgi:hypothetical protein
VTALAGLKKIKMAAIAMVTKVKKNLKFIQYGLSRFTRCGCFSYQVSSISVWRINCYDNFCVFSIFQHFGRFHGNGSHFEKINP